MMLMKLVLIDYDYTIAILRCRDHYTIFVAFLLIIDI